MGCLIVYICTWNEEADIFEFVNWIFFEHKVYCSCTSICFMRLFFFSKVLADLLDKVVAHLSSSSTECFFSMAQYKGQWGRGTHSVFFLTIESKKRILKGTLWISEVSQFLCTWDINLTSRAGSPPPKWFGALVNWTLTMKLTLRTWNGPKLEAQSYTIRFTAVP